MYAEDYNPTTVKGIVTGRENNFVDSVEDGWLFAYCKPTASIYSTTPNMMVIVKTQSVNST